MDTDTWRDRRIDVKKWIELNRFSEKVVEKLNAFKRDQILIFVPTTERSVLYSICRRRKVV